LKIIDAVKARSGPKRDLFVDKDAGLESDDEADKEGLLSRLKRRFSKGTGKRKTMVIKSGTKEESVIEIEDSIGFLNDLKVWYGGIKNASKEDPSCIAEAKKLSARASRRSRAKVIEEDAMNGEFMLRMMDAWANKKAGGGAVMPAPIAKHQSEETSDASAFSRAIQDVITEGVVADDNDDDDFPLEDVDDTDDDFIIQDIDEEEIVDEADESGEDADDFMLPSDEVEEDVTSEIVGEDEVSDAPSGQGEIKSIRTASYIIDIETRAAAIANFEDEWDEDLSEPNARRDFVNEMFDALEASLEIDGSEVMELSSFDAEEDQREIDWLQENIETLNEKRSAVLDLVAPISSSDDEEVESDDDLEAEFGIGVVGSDTSPEDNDDQVSEEVEFDDEDHSSNEINEVDKIEHEVAPEPEVESITSQEERAVAEAIQEDPIPDQEIAQEAPLAPHVPVNRSLGELEEIERSDELIYKWGYVAKGAGAAEAKISHSVLVKDGLRRRVVGISHLVAQWRKHDAEDNRRLNILLRYVPEGEWTLSMDNYRESGIKMVDTQGDFVQVSAEMLRQPEIENSIVLVHFYGPGVPSGTLEETGNVIVTTDTLSVDLIKEKMDFITLNLYFFLLICVIF